MQTLKILMCLLLTHSAISQTFLNGSFENNTLGLNDQINIASNSNFNAIMPNVNAFGTGCNLDIIQSAAYGGLAQHCAWYVALTSGGTDAIALNLSSPLLSGTTYTMSFWDRKWQNISCNPVQIGLSTSNNNVGTVIYTAPTAVNNTWTQRTFTFVAPNNGAWVTVIQAGPSNTSDWVQVDNFTLNNNSSVGGLTIVASTNTICSGSTAVFTVTGASSYNWLPAASLSSSTASVVTASPSVTTIYSVTGTSGSCAFTGNITLNVVNSISLSLTPTTPLCLGSSCTITASGSNSYSWGPPTGLNIATGSVVIASPGVSTTYTVTGGIGNCAASINVSIVPIPQITISSSPAQSIGICEGESCTLTANGASTYSWGSAGGLNVTTGNVVIATPSASSSFSVTGTSNTCSNVASISINVKPIPQLSVSAIPDVICKGDMRFLTVSGTNTFTWSPGSIQTQTFGLNTQSVGTASYMVVGQGTNGCVASKTGTFSVQICSGIEVLSQLGLRLYPNPAIETFTVFSTKDLSLRIYNALGQFIMEVNLDSNNQSAEVGPLQSGIYLVTDKYGNINQKVIVR